MPWGLWTWKILIQTSGLLCIRFSFLALYTLSAILKYSLSHTRPPEPLLAHLEHSLLPKISTLVMYISQNIDHFVIWYHQSAFGHQKRTFIEVWMTLLGEFLVTLQGRTALLSDVDVGQPRRSRWKNHYGRNRKRNMREGIRDKMVLFFGMNYGDAREELSQESNPVKLPSTQVGFWKIILNRLVVSTNYKAFPSKVTTLITQTLDNG